MVSASIHDAAGNLVARLDAGHKPAGTHRLNLSTESLAPGIYFCELEAGTWTRTVRLVKSH